MAIAEYAFLLFIQRHKKKVDVKEGVAVEGKTMWTDQGIDKTMTIRAGEIPQKISPPPRAHLMGPKNVPKKFGSSISSLAPPKICVFKNARFLS